MLLMIITRDVACKQVSQFFRTYHSSAGHQIHIFASLVEFISMSVVCSTEETASAKSVIS